MNRALEEAARLFEGKEGADPEEVLRSMMSSLGGSGAASSGGASRAGGVEEALRGLSLDGVTDGDLNKAMDGLFDNQMDGLFDEVMGSLFSRAVLLPPLEQLHERYPRWLEANKGHAEHAKFTSQAKIVAKIVKLFKDAGDQDPKTSEVMRLMDEMQALGNTPVDMMKELSPGTEFNPDGTPVVDPMADASKACNPS